ncbi:ATP-binding protein [Oleiharenicola sp. Vm1]|uniref:ATP-binding protein n=1 Tax=Oleiharenicola sp. Vm1 TaxID=3398393 RepID=UPI0039F562AF
MNAQLLTFVIAVSVGVSVFWSNPHRRINQAFTLMSLFSALWLGMLWTLTRHGVTHQVIWLKAISALGAYFPWILWWIGRCAMQPESRWRDFFVDGWYWALFAITMTGIALSDWFIPAHSTPAHPVRGPGYLAHSVGLVLAFIVLVAQATLQMRRLSGIQLVEVRTLLIGGAISGLVGLAFTAIPPLVGLPTMAPYASTAVLIFYALTAWGITSRRILDAQQLFYAVLRRAVVLIITSLLLSLWLKYTTQLLPAGVAMIVGLAACLAFAIVFEQRTKDNVFSSRTRLAEQVRAAMLSASRDETEPEILTNRYSEILRSWARTKRVEIHSVGDAHERWDLDRGSPGMRMLMEERWATPESLGRRRVTPAVEELDRFLATRKLGVAVLSPPARDTPPIAITLGRREDDMPFLWPDIQNLLEWSELMEVALSRAQLVKRARETEQVATAGLLGASLAHEIRNPLVALKTFAQLLPERHQDPEFRVEFSQVFQKEVARIEGLTEQLLKLSSPRKPVMRPVRLNEIVLDCAALMRPKFAESRIQLHLDLTPEERSINADAGSISQIILNLLVNAQQALADQSGDRLVTVRTRLGPREITLDVIDNGPGVSAEQRPRLFQPFSSGKVNGFGLGLAMSANIMRGHRGSIALIETGQPGATFRLSFPCPPS